MNIFSGAKPRESSPFMQLSISFVWFLDIPRKNVLTFVSLAPTFCASDQISLIKIIENAKQNNGLDKVDQEIALNPAVRSPISHNIINILWRTIFGYIEHDFLLTRIKTRLTFSHFG